jgi:hypothetical protein
MSERQTPETDAAIKAAGGEWSYYLGKCSRKLERECDDARELVYAWERRWEAEVEFAAKISVKRDEAREENAKLRDIAERAINYLDQSYRDGFSDEASDLRYELAQLKEETK